MMQLNYSHLKILKLKIYSSSLSFWSHFFVPMLLDDKILLLHIATIHIFSLSFSTQNSQLLQLVSLKSPLDWPKIWKGLLWQNNKIIMQENFATSIKMFTQNNLIMPIVWWYLPLVNLLSFFPILMNSR